MKSQLLEDMVDSQSSLSPPLNRRIPAATPVAAPPAAAPDASAHGAEGRVRAGVWRARAPRATSLWRPRPPASEAPLPPPAAVVAPPPDPPSALSSARPEPSLSEPDIASFSSRQPDWAAPLDTGPAPWTERWGRKALGWSLALVAVVGVAGAGAWMVRETRVESSLAIVADHSPAQAPATVIAAPTPDPVVDEPPPLRLLPRETPVAAAAEPAAPVEPQVAAPTPPPKKAEPPPRPSAKKPVAKRTPERRLATAVVKREKPAAKKPPKPKPPSDRALTRALADAQRSRQESLARPNAAPDPAASGTLAETLRLCRAAGYHANACMKRGCEATRFGLVCRG